MSLCDLQRPVLDQTHFTVSLWWISAVACYAQEAAGNVTGQPRPFDCSGFAISGPLATLNWLDSPGMKRKWPECTHTSVHPPWRLLGWEIVATHRGTWAQVRLRLPKPTQGSALVLTVRRGLLRGKVKVSLVTTFFGSSIQTCVYHRSKTSVCV